MYPGTVAMKPAQYLSAVALGAALMDEYGWSALSSIGHREHSSRKWDPGKLHLATLRKDIKELLDAGPEGEDVPLTDADAKKVAEAVWEYFIKPLEGSRTGQDTPAARVLQYTHANSVRALDRLPEPPQP
jgi:hypothetical protein